MNFYNDYVYTIELANQLYDFDIDKTGNNKEDCAPKEGIKHKDSLKPQK